HHHAPLLAYSPIIINKRLYRLCVIAKATDTSNMDIGERIREKRLEQGLTLERVAFDADMDASNLSRIERGMQQPSSALLKRIATALHISVSELYGELEGGNSQQKREPFPI